MLKFLAIGYYPRKKRPIASAVPNRKPPVCLLLQVDDPTLVEQGENPCGMSPYLGSVAINCTLFRNVQILVTRDNNEVC